MNKSAVFALASIAITTTTAAHADNIANGGFESQTSHTLVSPWFGDAASGVDVGANLAHSGHNNAWVRAMTGWHAVNQWISVAPNKKYRAGAWVRASPNMRAGYFSVRAQNGFGILNEHPFGATNGYEYMSFDFESGNNTSVLMYVGFWGSGADAWIQVDDVGVNEVSACAVRMKAYNLACYTADGTSSGFTIGQYSVTTCESQPVDLITAENHARDQWIANNHVPMCESGYLPCCYLGYQAQ
jgi:hypothetical protein